jgi:hypothetical protein
MPIIRPVEPNKIDKLKNLILFIAQVGANDPTLAAVKMNKILYFSDVRAYLELKRPITGVVYQHLPEGPAPRAMLPSQREMLNDGQIEIAPSRYFTQTQNRIVAKVEPNISMFDSDELRIVREVIQDLWGKSAKEVSKLSHDEWAYKLTENGEDIPLQLAWLSSDPLTLEQVEFGEELATRLNAR